MSGKSKADNKKLKAADVLSEMGRIGLDADSKTVAAVTKREADSSKRPKKVCPPAAARCARSAVTD